MGIEFSLCTTFGLIEHICFVFLFVIYADSSMIFRVKVSEFIVVVQIIYTLIIPQKVIIFIRVLTITTRCIAARTLVRTSVRSRNNIVRQLNAILGVVWIELASFHQNGGDLKIDTKLFKIIGLVLARLNKALLIVLVFVFRGCVEGLLDAALVV